MGGWLVVCVQCVYVCAVLDMCALGVCLCVVCVCVCVCVCVWVCGWVGGWVGGWVVVCSVCMCVRCLICVRCLCLYTAEYVLLLTLMSIGTTGNMRMNFPTWL